MLSRLMKRIGNSSISLIGGLLLIGFAFVYACGQIPDAPEAESAVGITAPDGFSVTCRTGFTRRFPHYCQNNDAILVGGIPWVNGVACTSRTMTGSIGLPASTLVRLQVNMNARANNVLGLRTSVVGFSRDAVCTNIVQIVTYTAYEHSAVVAGTVIAQSSFIVEVPLITTDSIVANQSNAGGNGNAEVFNTYLLGYYD